jgi:GNAT superfamily N-acetyltransferase
MSVVCRPATLVDAAQCVSLRAAAIAHQPPGLWSATELFAAVAYYTPEAMQTIMARPDAAFWLLESGDRPVGFTGIVGDYLHFLFVHPAAQGQGYGARLIRVAEDAIRATGATRAWLKAHPYAERFYLAHGYQPGISEASDFGAQVRLFEKQL